MNAPDVCITWLNVHGGVFHKLITLHERLTEAGLSCELLFSAGPPHGLKVGVDVPEALLPGLAARGIHFLPRAEVLQKAETSPARLLIADAHHDPDLPGLIARARLRGVVTAQLATLLGDFTSHFADHLLLQHPLTLFFELEYNHTRESHRFFQAKGIHFTGNLFFEPTVNTLVDSFASREDFCAKYGIDSARPLCLWLPNAVDARSAVYGQVLRMAGNVGLNLLVKLHPWEYAFKKHGTDTWGLGTTSDVLWNARAVDEPDGAWAYRFCDLAVMSTSATCLEMPFWGKPSVLLPSASHPGLMRAQARLVADCSVSLDAVEQLPDVFSGPLPHFLPADYASACAQVRQDCSRDAYVQTVAAIETILAAPETAGHLSSPAALRRLYDPFVSQELRASLSASRRLRYDAGRLLRRLTA
ncbi:MAG: hypothetical protein P4L39_09940 [Humidesulfovibrio sp.]|nr:hypothetical protein [Humidesulfovibrio sp.]